MSILEGVLIIVGIYAGALWVVSKIEDGMRDNGSGPRGWMSD